MEILLLLRVVVIVAERKPSAIGRVVVAGVGQVVVVGEGVALQRVGARRRGLRLRLRVAGGQRRRGQPAHEHQPDVLAPFHVAIVTARSAHDGCGDDEANAEDDRRRDDGDGDVLVLQDLLVQVAGRELVEEPVPDVPIYKRR